MTSFGSFALRDIERLGFDRMAREDKAALAVLEAPNAVPATSVTPESPSDSVGAKHEGTEVPAAGIPVHRAMPSGAESAFLVGADLDHSNRIP